MKKLIGGNFQIDIKHKFIKFLNPNISKHLFVRLIQYETFIAYYQHYLRGFKLLCIIN